MALPPSAPNQPQPTSGRENNRVTYWFAGVAAVVLALVLGFNLLGPRSPPSSGAVDGPARASAAAGDRSTSQPQASESATPPGRETQGAPQGASPRPATQDQAAGSPAQAVPPEATSPASATPAAPPAFR